MIETNDETHKRSIRGLSAIVAVVGVLAAGLTIWQWTAGHPLRTMAGCLFLVVSGVYVIVLNLPNLRHWLSNKLRTVEMVSTYERTVDALELRGNVLGVVADVTDWIGEYSSITEEASRNTFFSKLNNAFIDSIRDLFPTVERIALFVPLGDGLNLAIQFSARFTPRRQNTLRLAISRSAAGHAYKTGTTYFSTNVKTEPNSIYQPFPDSQPISTLLCVPIKAFNAIYGVLSMDSVSPAAIDSDIVELVETLCGIIALAWALHSAGKTGGTK